MMRERCHDAASSESDTVTSFCLALSSVKNILPLKIRKIRKAFVPAVSVFQFVISW